MLFRIQCFRFAPYLWDYAAGRAPDADGERMAIHLRQCARCTRQLELHRTTLALLASASAGVPARPGNWSVLRGRLESSRSAPAHHRGRSPLLRISGTALAAALVVVVASIHRPPSVRTAAVSPSRPPAGQDREGRAMPHEPNRPVEPVAHSQDASAELPAGWERRFTGTKTRAVRNGGSGRPHSGPDDERYLDGRSPALLECWSAGGRPDPQLTAWMTRPLPPMEDDFVQPPLPLLADAGNRGVADAAKRYEQEAKIVDGRLFRKVTLALKSVSLDELCIQLEKQAGVRLHASRGVMDEKVTVFVDERPVRDVMREVARLFGYLWGRSGEEGSYQYELVQDLRSQLAEEELRTRDLHAALVAVDDRMGAYRVDRELSPEQLRERARTLPEKDQQRLINLSYLWGGVQLYHRLTPAQFTALRNGSTLYFAPEGEQLSLPGVPAVENSLPREWHDTLIRMMGSVDVGTLRRMPQVQPGEETRVKPYLGIRIDRSELGQVSLIVMNGIQRMDGSGELESRTLASGQSASVAKPDNAQMNRALKDEPSLRREVSVRPSLSCYRCRAAAVEKTLPFGDNMWKWSYDPLLRQPHVTSADVWEAIHQETGMPIVADSYTRLYPQPSVTVKNSSAFDALCAVGDEMHVRWRKDGAFILGRSTSFYWDKLKEVPNRLLRGWERSRQEKGMLPLEQVLEMAQLSDQQLDSEVVGKAVTHCCGVEEWTLFGDQVAQRSGSANRPYYRFAASLSPAQLQRAAQLGGLPWTAFSPAQRDALTRLDPKLAGTGIRITYVPNGWHVWEPRLAREVYTDPLKFPALPVIADPTAVGALAKARGIEPRATAEEIRRYQGVLAVAFVAPDGATVATFGRPLISVRTD